MIFSASNISAVLLWEFIHHWNDHSFYHKRIRPDDILGDQNHQCLKIRNWYYLHKSFHHSSWETRHVFQPLNCWSEDKRQKRHTDSQNLEEFSQDKNWASVHHKPELGSSSSVRCVCTLKTRANTRASKPPHNVQISSINHPLITHFFHVIFPVWAQKAWWNLQNTNCTALH